jgi:thiol-disulfide isomerase/thioredoxin
LPRCPRHGGILSHRALRRPRARASLLALAGALSTALALGACDSGAIGNSGPGSNGQSFVPGSPGTTVYGGNSGPVAPRVTGTLLSGSKFTLAADHGHVVVMNFWGSWCTPCRAEAPFLSRLAQHFTPSGVKFLGIDIRDSPATAEAFQRDFHIGYPSLNDPGDEIALDFRDTVPPAGIPTTLVIGRDGRIAARVIGEVSYPGLRGLISRALAQSA